MATSTAGSEQLKAGLEQRLVESGEKERLQDLIRAKLVECGWKDQVKTQCREVIKEKGIANITVEELLQTVVPSARENVPDEVKAKVLSRLKGFLLTNLQDLEQRPTPPS
ncbi:Transcription and mRNA export factor eny2 [Dimargaris xerosporica]|nr:Transcription and mRNA export factor eny2 [Dimargaris xerosporica]